MALGAVVLATGLWASPALGRTDRPAAAVYVVKYRGTYRIRRQRIRHGSTYFLTRSQHAPTGLQCTADGRYVVYVNQGDVYARRVRRRGKPVKVGSLPKTVWQLYRHRARSFVRTSPSGRYVALPDKQGVYVYDLKTRKSLLIKPPTPSAANEDGAGGAGSGVGKGGAGRGGKGGDRGGASSADGSDDSSGGAKVRVIHPARWFPTRDRLLYLTQQGEKGRGAVNARVFSMTQGRHTVWFPVLGKPVDAVSAFDAVFSHDGARLGLSLAIRRGKRRLERIKVISINPYKELRFPKRLRVGRVHGFDPRLGDVVVTGRLGRRKTRLYSYSFKRKRKRLLDIGFLSSQRMVVGFSPERRTALVAAPLRKRRCRGKHKLFKASVRHGMRSLVRWARWTEIVATDPTDAWYIFRSSSTCRHRRPTLYLMMADGWGLLRDLPRRFAALRRADPQDVALCPVPASKRRRRRGR